MKKEIEFLLFKSGVSNYQISQATGISQVVLSKYKNGKSDVGRMTLDNAEKLYEYFKEWRKINMKFTIIAEEEFVNQYGMLMTTVAKEERAYNEEQAVEIAKSLYDEGKYCSIFISYNHPDSSCYYNPGVGFEPTGKNWVTHFENM